MKKFFCLLIVFAVLLTGCNSAEAPSYDEQTAEAPKHSAVPIPDRSDELVEIKEKMFIAQTNDIYYNKEDYLGKTIKYEGLFNVYDVPEFEENIYSVIRYGPGCCGNDSDAGFEVRWDKEYPNKNDWVEAVGILEQYEYEEMEYLRLALTSLTVLDVRGEETVSQ